MSTELSVIIPAYNCERDLASLLPSLKRTRHPSYEVIVVDDGSADGTAAKAESFDA
jgi:glycosyltransferase involved in cell wall biosynthesis